MIDSSLSPALSKSLARAAITRAVSYTSAHNSDDRHCVIDDQGALRPLSRSGIFLLLQRYREYKQLKDTYVKNVVYPRRITVPIQCMTGLPSETIEPSRNGWLGFVDPAGG